MRGVVPGELFDGDVMLPDLKVCSPARSDLKFQLLWLKVNDVKGVFPVVIVIIVVVIAGLGITHVGTGQNDGIGAFLH